MSSIVSRTHEVQNPPHLSKAHLCICMYTIGVGSGGGGGGEVSCVL